MPNHFDLDSDNDGITDVFESGGTDIESNVFLAVRDGCADGKVGKNGAQLGIPASANTGTVAINTDGTGNYDFLDIDSDDDGIPDNVEAHPTIGYITPSPIASAFVDANKDGYDDNYTMNNKPEDTDYDGICDYVDLDSDNDGLPDIEENGMANAIVSFSDTDNDGLDLLFKDCNINDSFDVNDQINNPSTSILPDTDGDLYSGGDLDYRDLFNTNPPLLATLDFDGVDDYLSTEGFVEGLTQATLMAWIKIDVGNASETFTTIAGEDVALRLRLKSGDEIEFEVRTTNGGYTLKSDAIAYNEWHNVTGVFDNTNGAMILYILMEEN
ncbi:LamG-like jellyroll fold domain-containing protein [Winogradskyella sp.]|uniref:LamG-like jellyroll fold domain-containing protein n=1 Tax=Winogradskyella sp. TaxID=1883156 RepID=UPI003F6BD750